MLEKMGWKRGDGLGKDGKGMKNPVRERERGGSSFSNKCGISLDSECVSKSIR